MNPLSSGPFSAFVGIDWADKKHDICLQGAVEETRELGRIAHQPQAIDQWAQAMFERFGGRIAVALELSKEPLVYALQKYDFIVLFLIPSQAAMIASPLTWVRCIVRRESAGNAFRRCMTQRLSQMIRSPTRHSWVHTYFRWVACAQSASRMLLTFLRVHVNDVLLGTAPQCRWLPRSAVIWRTDAATAVFWCESLS